MVEGWFERRYDNGKAIACSRRLPRSRGTRTAAGILLGALVLGCAALYSIPDAQAQSARTASERQTVDFSIPSQELTAAIDAFCRAADWQVGYGAAIDGTTRTGAVSGIMSPEQALRTMLAGTGITIRITGPSGAVLVGSTAASENLADDDTLLLDTITIEGGTDINSEDAPYKTAAPTSYISGQTIERSRGSSPADLFRGTPGVMSGEARNSGSSVDVNIRGMQGMGRVAMTVDGTMNSANVYQGYQGISNRTFVDPDFLAGIDITKGADVASRGIAGTVSMRTVEARDIVKEGQTAGLRLKTELGNNTSKPVAGNRAGYSIINRANNDPIVTSSPDGMDRPGTVRATQRSGSAIAAIKLDKFDFVAGYAHRQRGNYHAGERGPSANPVSTGPRPFCYSSGFCPPYLSYPDYVVNEGLANYRAGEEVLNTELETISYLAKGTVRLGDEHLVQLGYMWFDSEAGDRLASRLTTDISQAEQQDQTVGSELGTATLKYRYQPIGSDLIEDLKVNLWRTDLELRNQRRAGTPWSPIQPDDLGLPDNFRVGTDNVMWGADATNTSSFDLARQAFSLTYGLSYLSEDTRPSAYTVELEDWLKVRDGSREEAAAFAKVGWDPTDWMTVNAGLRYQYFWSEDRTEADPTDTTGELRGQKLSSSGWSPHLGVTFEPFEGTQLYVNYSSAQRAPSIMEALTGFSTRFNPDLEPERSNNWEIGANIVREGNLTREDRGMLKFGYFNWDVENYLARQWKQDFVSPDGGYTFSSMYVYNIDSAKFEGLEFSGRYELGGFSAELAANYYLNVEFCPTGDTCGNESLFADYATNQIPPKYSIDLTASQKLFDDRLTIGGRVSRVGRRAIEHGKATAGGSRSFINQIEWDPYTLMDLFAEFRIGDNFMTGLRVENLTDRYYVDPLSLVQQPGPGRTVYLTLSAEF